MKNILVTGGAGFIGSNFLNLINRKKNFSKIIILDKLTYAANYTNISKLIDRKRVIFIKGDISNYNLVSKILNKYKIQVVFNFAAESHVDNSINNSNKFIKTNIIGTHNLLKCCYESWNNKYNDKLFFHISTDEVFGHLTINQKKFTEKTNFNPRSPYSASKASSDLLVKSFHSTYKLPYVITNCSNNYGPLQFPEKLIPLTIRNLVLRKSILIYGNGKNIRDWIHVDDHCRAIYQIFKSNKFQTTFNVGGNNQIRNIDLVNDLCYNYDLILKRKNLIFEFTKNSRNLHFDSKFLIKFVIDRKGHDFRYDLNTSKIKKEITFLPKINFKDGLQKTLLWYLKNPKYLKI